MINAEKIPINDTADMDFRAGCLAKIKAPIANALK